MKVAGSSSERGRWRERSEKTELVDIVISGTGGLSSRWDWPNIEGIHDLKGKEIHSASYKQKAQDFEEKAVAIVRSGSSSTQMVPALQPCAKRVAKQAAQSELVCGVRRYIQSRLPPADFSDHPSYLSFLAAMFEALPGSQARSPPASFSNVVRMASTANSVPRRKPSSAGTPRRLPFGAKK